MKALSLVTAVLSAGICAGALPAAAQNYIEFDSPVLNQNVQHSRLTNEAVVIPPYERAFPVRVYTTPPQPPFYNVPPYRVISPY